MYTWIPEWVDQTQQSEWLELFKISFQAEMTPQFLKWKYRDTVKMGIGVKRDEKLVAFYGGMPRDIILERHLVHAVQIGDVMVHPSERGAFTRKGAFLISAESFISQTIGTDKAYKIAFGFPSKRHYTLGEKLGLYDIVNTIKELSWTVKQKPSFSLWNFRNFEESDLDYIPRLWGEMVKNLPKSAIGIRDNKWIKSRYLDHPDKPYKMITVHRRWSKKPEGVLVFRDRGADGMEWIDMVGDITRLPAFCSIAYKFAFEHFSPRLFCWMTQSHLSHFEKTRPLTSETDIVIPITILTDGLKPEQIKDRWWLMAGDTDFR